MSGYEILIAGALLAAGILASLMANRVRVPALLLFLGVGMLLGSDVTGLIDFSDYDLAADIGIVALALILFEGGLTSGLLEIRPVLGPALALAVVGTIVTAAGAGLAAMVLFDLSLLEGLLIGAVVSATDGAAIFGLLRTSSLKKRLARTLEGESGFNDPVAIFLTIGFVEWLTQPDYGVGDMALLFVEEMGIGAVVGAAVGWLAVQAFRRARLASAGLYPVASLAVAALAFGIADALEGSGFLAVYLAGLALGTAAIPAKLTITVFHEGVAWIAQVVLFLALGLLVFPAALPDVALEGTLLALVLVFVARPVATVVSLPTRKWSINERVVLSAAGLRGAVPVVLATFPVVAGVEGAQEIFNIVFFAVLVSVLAQGVGFEPIARRLGATTTAEASMPRPLAEAGTIRGLGAEVLDVPVKADDAITGARVRDLALPREAVVSVIVREEEAIPPRGSTRLRAGDRLHLLLREESSAEVQALLQRWREGPIGPLPRPPRAAGRLPIFSVGRPKEIGVEGQVARPDSIGGNPTVDLLRIRRDVPGSLVALGDGRFAVAGPLVAIGSRDQLNAYARRRARRLPNDSDERAWWQTVVGALAADEGT